MVSATSGPTGCFGNGTAFFLVRLRAKKDVILYAELGEWEVSRESQSRRAIRRITRTMKTMKIDGHRSMNR
jgi:hypothetical protein